MTPEQLRASILQYAVQGKLVEQKPEEGTSEELYHRLKDEKLKLVEKGIIKKGTAIKHISDDEIPFEIPENWKWVRLGMIFNHNTGKALNSSNTEGEKLDYITTSNLYWNRFELDGLKQMFFKKTEIDKCTATKGDLLVCEGGDVGRAAIWTEDYDIRIQNHIHKLRSYVKICTEYYYYIFYLYKSVGLIGGRGIGIKGLSSNALHNIVVPLPPLEEQYRIVKKIEEILPYVDRYADSYNELEQFNNAFPERMKNSILQYAVQGKLVEQRAEEGTADELYQKIKTEKEELIKEGKAKKSKVIAEIGEEELPFEIPKSWEWVRLSSISHTITKGTTPRGGKNAYKEEGVGFLRAENVAGLDNLDKTNMKFVDYSTHESFLSRSILESGDILVTIAGSLGRTALVREDDLPLNTNQAVSIVRLINKKELNLQYIIYAINSPLIQSLLLKQKKKVGVGNLTLEIIGNCLIPLPPLKEQRRIVAKIEELLPYCERLN